MPGGHSLLLSIPPSTPGPPPSEAWSCVRPGSHGRTWEDEAGPTLGLAGRVPLLLGVHSGLPRLTLVANVQAVGQVWQW